MRSRFPRRIAKFGLKGWRLEFIEAGLTFAAILAVALKWRVLGTLIAQTDTPPLLHPFLFLRINLVPFTHFVEPFGSYQLATDWPYFAVLGPLSHILGRSTGQVTLMALLAFAAVWGTRNLLVELGSGRVASLVGGWLVILNPFVMLHVFNLVSGGTMVAIMPWMLLDVIGGVTEKRRAFRTARLVSISSFAVAITAITPPFVFELLLFLAVVSLIIGLRKNRAPGYWAWLLSTACACVIGSLWWLITTYVAVHSGAIAHSTNPQSEAWTFERSSLLNLMRFVGFWTWQFPEYFPFARAYDANPIWYASGFTLIASGLLAVIFAEKNRSIIRAFCFIALAGIFLCKGFHPPLAFLNSALFSLPFFFLIMEPGLLLAISALSLAIVCGLFLDEIIERFPRVIAVSCVVLVLFGGIASSWYLIDGEIAHGASSWMPADHVKIPSYWREAATYVRRHGADGMVFALPSNRSYQAFYDWGYFGPDVITQELFGRPVMLAGAPISYVSDPRTSDLRAQINSEIRSNDPRVIALLRSFGFQYVLLREDMRSIVASPVDDLSHARYVFRRLQFKKFGPLLIYNLGSDAATFASMPANWSQPIIGAHSIGAIAEHVKEQFGLSKVPTGRSIHVSLTRANAIALPLPGHLHTWIFNGGARRRMSFCAAVPARLATRPVALIGNAIYRSNEEGDNFARWICFGPVLLNRGYSDVHIHWRVPPRTWHSYERPGANLRVGDFKFKTLSHRPRRSFVTLLKSWHYSKSLLDAPTLEWKGNGLPPYSSSRRWGYVLRLNGPHFAKWCWIGADGAWYVESFPRLLECAGNPVHVLAHARRFHISRIGFAMFDSSSTGRGTAQSDIVRRILDAASFSATYEKWTPNPPVPYRLELGEARALPSRSLGPFSLVYTGSHPGTLITRDLASNWLMYFDLSSFRFAKSSPDGIIQAFKTPGTRGIYFNALNLVILFLEFVGGGLCLVMFARAFRRRSVY